MAPKPLDTSALIVLLSLTLWLAACQPEVRPNYRSVARTAQATAQIAERWNPSEAERVISALAAAEEASALEAKTRFWQRRPPEASLLWQRLAIIQYEVRRQGLRHYGKLEQEWARIEAQAAEDLARASLVASQTGNRKQAARSLSRGTIQLSLARRLAEAGRVEQAIAEARASIEEAERVNSGWAEIRARFDRADLTEEWRRWVAQTTAESRRNGTAAIVIYKLDRRLDLLVSGRRVASFEVDLGANGLRRKLFAGDRATPEGRYRVTTVKVGGSTRFYKALLIDYPNATDRVRFEEARRRREVPPNRSIGNLIEIHGDGGRNQDWTDGCIALSNADMDRLLARVGVGTPVTIVGKP